MSAASPARPARHDRTGIVETALTLLDAHGLADLSMRRLAAALDVQPSALYWHFDSKQALLAAVADRIVAAADVPSRPGSPAEELVAVARALRSALFAHRDGAEVVMSTYALALGSGAARARLRAAFPPGPESEVATDVVFEFVLGNAAVVQQRIQAARLGVVDADPAAVATEAARDFDRALSALLRGVGPLLEG